MTHTYTHITHLLDTTHDFSMDTTAKDTTLDSSALTDSSLDTTWNTSTGSDNDDADQTKVFKLRSSRIECKAGISKKFVLDDVRTPKRKPHSHANV